MDLTEDELLELKGINAMDHPPAPLKKTPDQLAAEEAMRKAEAEAEAAKHPNVLKWVGIGDKPVPEYVSRCGYFKARRVGKKWRLWMRNDPETEADYEDTEQVFDTKKALQQECEAVVREAEAEAAEEIPFG